MMFMCVNGDPALFHTSKTAKMLYYLEHIVRMSTCYLVK